MGLELAEKDFEVGGDFYLYPTVYAGPMSNQVQMVKDRRFSVTRFGEISALYIWQYLRLIWYLAKL